MSRIDFSFGDTTFPIDVDQKTSLYSQLGLLRSKCNDANAELVFLYKGKEVDIYEPVLSQVSADPIITVGKRCVMMIEWNGESKYVKYISSIPNRCIIEAAMKKFNIAIPFEELYLLSQDGKQKFDENQTIPFDGYGNTSCILYRKSNMVIDNTDSSDDETGEICIDCDGEMNKYSYDKNKTIQDYFYQYLKDNSYEDVVNDTCLTSKDKQGNRFYYDFNSTLADLKIKPKDTLYFTFKGDVIFSYIVIYHQAKDKQFQYTFDTNKKTSEYISAVLQDSSITPTPMRLKTYVLVMEGSNSPLDSSKGLSEQGVVPNSTLRLMTKSDLPKREPVVKRVITIIDKGKNQSKEYEYDGNKTVNDYRLLLWNDIGVKVTPMRLKAFAVVIEGTKEKLELSVPLKDLTLPEAIKFEVVTLSSLPLPMPIPMPMPSPRPQPIHPSPSPRPQPTPPSPSPRPQPIHPSPNPQPLGSCPHLSPAPSLPIPSVVNQVHVQPFHEPYEGDDMALHQGHVQPLHKPNESDESSPSRPPIPLPNGGFKIPAIRINPQPQTKPDNCSVVIMDLASGNSIPRNVNSSSIQNVINSNANALLSHDRDNWVLLNKDGQCKNPGDIQCNTEIIHLYVIAKSVLSFNYLQCVGASADGGLCGITETAIKTSSLPPLSVEWKSIKIDYSKMQSILKNDSFKVIQSIIVSDELTTIQGKGSLSYRGGKTSIYYSSLSIPFSCLLMKGLKGLLSLVFDKLKKTISLSVLIKQKENQTKLDTIEHECVLFKQTHTGATILVNGRDVHKKDEPEPEPEPEDDYVRLEFTGEHFDQFNSPDCKLEDPGVPKKQRSYRNDESILVGVLTKDGMSLDTVTLNSMNVHYNHYGGSRLSHSNLYISLPSALTDGMDSLHKNGHMFFSGIPRLKKNEIKFILPLLPNNGTENIIPETVYMFCINNVKGASLGILEENSNKPISVHCDSNVLIFHSSSATVQVIKAFGDHPNEWNYIQLSNYRSVKASDEDFPYLKETEQTKKRDQVVKDVIQFNIPTIIEGVTSSGKTFTVEQYCMRAQLPLVRYNFSPSSSIEELIGDMIINEKGDICYKDGPFTEAFVMGKILLLDEMSLAPSTIIQSLLSYLLGKKLLYESGETNEERSIHPFFRVIATQNPAGSSYKRSSLSSSIRDCFRVVTHTTKQRVFPSIEDKELQSIITGIFNGDSSIGFKITKAHQEASRRKFLTRKAIDQGKDYTLRDCSRVKAIMKVCKEEYRLRENDAVTHAIDIAYNNPLTKSHLKAPSITFNEDRIDKKCWENVHERMKLGLQGGCHILLVGKTEYAARKFCHSYLKVEEDITSSIIHCTSSSSSEGIIGSYAIDTTALKPQFVKSGLLEAIENGGICVLQNMELMKSNVIERMNSVLEVVPTDGRVHRIRFDENHENPVIEMNPDFRIIATTSEAGLCNFSPALRNRFLEVFIDEENDKNMKNDIEEISWDVIDEEGIITQTDRDAIDKCVKYAKKDSIVRNSIRMGLVFLKRLTNLEVSKEVVKAMDSDKLPFVIDNTLPLDVVKQLFMSISMNKATAFYGRKSSGKTFIIEQLLSILNIEQRKILHVSSETDYASLMGTVDIKGNFNPGVLYNAVKDGCLVIFENAENMSNELIEMLDSLVDPFTHSTVYPVGEDLSIHPAFRALFVFTINRETLSNSLPAYYKQVKVDPINSTRCKQFISASPVCQLLCEFIDSGEVSLNDILTLNDIAMNNKEFSVIEIFACLFAERSEKKEFANEFVEKCKNKGLIEDDEVRNAEVILSTPTVSLRDDKGQTQLSRGSICISSRIPYDSLRSQDRAIQTAVFTSLLTRYHKSGKPLMLVGDPEITSVVANLLEKDATRIEMSRSMEMVHSFGEISICKKEDIEYIIVSCNKYPSQDNPLELYRGKLHDVLKEKDDNSMDEEKEDDNSILLFRPGPIMLSIMSGVPLIINNVSQLNDRLKPRLYGLLSNLRTDNFVLYEDNSYQMNELVANNMRAIVTTDKKDYSHIERKDLFVQVFCQEYSEQEYGKYDYVDKEKYSLSILKKADLLSDFFEHPREHIPFYLHYLESDLSTRIDYLGENENDAMKDLNRFLSLPQSVKDEVMIENIQSYSTVFKESILTKAEESLITTKRQLLPTKTTIHLLLSVILADESHLPIILEGDPGVGKTAAAENYMINCDMDFERINFSNNSSIDNLFGCYTLVNGEFQFKYGSITNLLLRDSAGKRKALLLDEVNLAPSDVLEVLLSLIHAYCHHESFRIPGNDSIDLPEDMLICCCMNPASMSANRSSLPRQFFSYCIYHRDLQYSLWELIITAKSILDQVIPQESEGNSKETNEMIQVVPEERDSDNIKITSKHSGYHGFSDRKSIDNMIFSLFRYTLESRQKTSIPFSLRDVLKVQQICESGEDLSLIPALWLVFACRYEKEERKEIERILDQKDNIEISIEKKEDRCIVNGFCTIDTKSEYDGCFKEWCFTTSEHLTMFKLCLALKSKRAMLLYGASPSGKSYVVSKVAEMHGRRCRTVYLNHESTPEVFIGRCSLSNKNGIQDIGFRDGPLVEAIEKGEWIVIEDIHLANSDVMEALNSLCEENPILKVMKGNKEVTYVSSKPREGQKRIHPDFRLFFTISDTTLKHFTGPFLSRCVILFCDSIANAQSVQEICRITESSVDPRYFGDLEAESFRRCCRVIGSREKDAFSIEFERDPTQNELLAKNEIHYSVEHDLEELSDELEGRKKDVKKAIELMVRLAKSSPRSFDTMDVSQRLCNIMKYFDEHFVGYVMNAIDMIISKQGLINSPLTKQDDESAIILSRWCLLSSIDPGFEKGYSVKHLVDSQRLPLETVFNIDKNCLYQLVLLYYILNRTTQFLESVPNEYVRSLFESGFNAMNGMEKGENIEELAKNLQSIKTLFDELNPEKKPKKVRTSEYNQILSKEEDFDSICKSLPESVTTCNGLKEIKVRITNYIAEMKELYLKSIDIDIDSEESQRVNFETAKHTGSQYGNFNEVLKEVFKGMMSKEVFMALRMNEQDSRYVIWKYQGEYGRLLVKTSHLIYKLKQFNCPAIILNEYVDVLDALKLDIRDILKNFSVYDEIREDLFVVLNCLLIREMKRLKWNDVLRSHHQYPFQMPSSVTKEQYEAAIDAFIDCNWYESYVKDVKINSKKVQRYAQLKEQLMKRYSEDNIPLIQLLSPGLIRAVDTATGLEEYSFSQIAVVDSTWREFECSEVGEGVLIPTHVMQMEYYVLSQRESSNSELSFVWSDQCYLSIKEKLEIICPRKRTLPGDVVINMLNNEQLKEITIEELRIATSIDDLVYRVRQRKEVMVDDEIAQLNLQLVKTNERLEDLKDRRDAYLNQLNTTRDYIIQHYTDIADKKNAQSGLSKEEQERNDITISTWAYLTAVNRLEQFYLSDHRIYNLPVVITAELNTHYSAFDFQILWVSYRIIQYNPTVTLVTPPGLEFLVPNRVMNLQQYSMNQLSYKSGYAIVLPLAPFEWTVMMEGFEWKDYCLYYYPNSLRGINSNAKKSEKTTTIVTCQLLQSMIHYRDKFNLKYAIPRISVSDLFPFAKNHYSSNKGPSVAVSNYRIVLYTRDSNVYRLPCYPIENASQLCPFPSVQFTNQRVHYSYSHYISANTSVYSEIRCYNPEERIPDIDQYNQLVKSYNECIKDCNLAEVDCKKINDSIVSARSTFIADYFFPSQITTTRNTSVAKSLDSILVIIRNGDEVTVSVPKNDTFALPDSIKGIDGNVIRIPYMMIGDGMVLTVESESTNCNVGVQGGEIVIEIVDDELGFKLYELIAVVKDSNMKVLTRRVFNITFERKMVENLIRTSKCCSCKTTSQWSLGGYYYTLTLYPSSLPIDIWVGNEKRTYKNQSSSGYYYYPKKSRIIHGTNIVLSDEYDKYGKDMEFVYDAQSIKPLTRYTVSNTIAINTTVKTDSTKTLQMMKSESIQEFLSSFTNLSITILQAKERDKERLMSLLNNCCESPYLLPAIKSKAEQVKRSITQNESILKWSSDQIDLERKSGMYSQNDVEGVDYIDGGNVVNKLVFQNDNKSDEGISLTTSIIDETITRSYRIAKEGMEDAATIFKGVVINTEQIKKEDQQKQEEEKRKNERKKDELNESKEDYKPVDYKAYLKMMEKESMDSLYQTVVARKNDVQFVAPRSHKNSMTKVTITDDSMPIDTGLRDFILYHSAKLINDYSVNGKLRYTPNHVCLIMDTNFTHRKNKARRRSLITSILVCTCMELGIPFSLYLSISRCRGCYVEIEKTSLDRILSLLFDIEEIVKIPSTPLDLLTVEKCIDKEDMCMFIGDGFSEQLLSTHSSVTDFFKLRGEHLFMLCIKGKNEEALSSDNQTDLENGLKNNFNNNLVIIDKISDIRNSSLYEAFFSSKEQTTIPTHDVQDIKPERVEFNENLDSPFTENSSVVQVESISSTHNAEMISIKDDELNRVPEPFSDNSAMRQLSTYIKSDNLFDSLSINIFIPNKSTAYVPATSGSAIHIPNYIKYLVTKMGDGKFFKKLGSEKVRSYNCAIVIDCSQLAFGAINHLHSIITVFTILRNISNLQLPCVDIWVARESVIRIATGVSSMDLWENNIIYSLYYCLTMPVPQTALYECLRRACCTCNSRSFSSVVFVLTNGVSCTSTRSEIQSIVSSIEMTYVGIGLGLYLNNFEKLFPTMVWHSNPARLSDTIMNFTTPSKNTTKFAIKEKKLMDVVDIKNHYGNATAVKSIEGIPSLLEMMIQNIRLADATKGENDDVTDFSSNQNDLGPDGGFSDFTILFVVLYLCRGNKSRDGSIIDKDITEDILRYGNKKSGFSPFYKLGNRVINGKQQGKCFNILYATDYETAIRHLHNSRVSAVFITCSPGDGIFPGKDENDEVKKYADSFIENIHYFNQQGGGVFWFLENYPFTYEADLYFKKFYKFDLTDKEEKVDGGKTMTRVNNPNPTSGHFRTIGGKHDGIRHLSSLDFGITRIFEGKTLCKMDENKLQKNDFSIFAREHEGHASIVVRDTEGEGRMIIDTAASKLFLEFSSDGTARWISNAAVWLCKPEQVNITRQMNPEYKPGIDMSGLRNYLVPKEFEPREDAIQKQVLFCVTVIMDTTGSMCSSIDSAKEQIRVIFNKLDKIRKDHNIQDGGVVGQVIQYKDYSERSWTDNNCSITSDFSELERRLKSFKASGGGDGGVCGSWCEDMHYGMDCALNNMEKDLYKDYSHLMLIVGDVPCHGDEDSCRNAQHPFLHMRIGDVWPIYFKRMKRFNDLKITFIPIDGDGIRATYNRFCDDGLNVSLESNTSGINLSSVIDSITQEHYNYLLGITKN